MSTAALGRVRELWASGADLVWREDASTGRSFVGTGGTLVRGEAFWALAEAVPAAGSSDDPTDGAGPVSSTRHDWVGWLPYEAMTARLGVLAAPGADAAQAEPRFLRIDRSWSSCEAPRTAPVKHGQGHDAIVPLDGLVRWEHGRERYLEAIARAQAAIVDGEVFVLCLTTRAEVAGEWDGLETYLALRAANPTAHLCLMRLGELTLVAASPERFVTLGAGGRLVTHPIKGTAPRHADPAADAAEARDLAANPKERAENVMIVDVARNDLHRVCEPGSVTVERLWGIDSYAGVHQLVSEVSGRVREGVSVAEVLSALSPGCSMTGAPKHRAARLIAELEPAGRGVYSGAFGALGADGTLDLAMAIRCLVLTPGSASIGVGGGITADSVPAAEWDEVLLKARGSLGALRASVRVAGRGAVGGTHDAARAATASAVATRAASGPTSVNSTAQQP